MAGDWDADMTLLMPGTVNCPGSFDAAAMNPATSTEVQRLVSFAKRAFGLDRLPALQLLAFGHFSREDRYPNQQFLVRRVDSVQDRRYNVDSESTRGYEFGSNSLCSAQSLSE